MNSSQKAWLRALERTAAIHRNPTVTLPSVIAQVAERQGSASALISRDVELTYGELAAASNRYARWGLARGFERGAVVGLLMTNSPHYLAIWLGLTRIGVTVSLLNTQLTGELLAHAIATGGMRALIVGADRIEAYMSARPHMRGHLECIAYGAGAHDLPRIDVDATSFASELLPEVESPLPSLEDRALLIYTSGTTGLPKAAIVSHYRLMQWSHWFAGLMDTRPSDRMYNCLPLYHSVGGVVATGATLVGGGAVVLRERFSASEFWTDVSDQRCTLFQYIGELCRYLLNSAPQADEHRHGLRLCCGNGLRPEVWEPFRTRFRIPQILEYYASTEGNFSLYNCEGKPGAVGRIPPFLAHRMPVTLVKFDETQGMPLRDESGRCVRCATNEIGEAIGQLTGGVGKSVSRFEGYVDAQASRQKILRDVFAPGDTWYRTGDLMRRDEQGFFYFIDRVGDTFRWKGENVSTGEVAGILSTCPGVDEAVVYGVAVPGADGRAGMAAIVVGPGFSLERLRSHAQRSLPDYARPVFVRLVRSIEMTGTFKLKKQDLARQGYDPAAISDALFVDDRDRESYVPLDSTMYAQLGSGRLRL